MSVYGMAINTVLHCFCLDEHMHKSAGGPKHCPSELAKFIDTHGNGNQQPPSQ